MQRQGWAFCLGLLLTGLAAAQPPAEGERYPPAPDLPGVVVGTTNSGKPVGAADPSTTKLASVQPSEPAATPKSLDGEPTPAGPAITATTEPVEIPAGKTNLPVSSMTCAASEKCCPSGCCSSGCLGRVVDWMLFRSHARQHGCYPSPYRPPLFTWFPCGPRSGPYGSCASGKCGVTAPPMIVNPPLNPQELPLPGPSPAGPTPKVLDENGSATRQVPPITIEPEPELPGAIRVDTGLRFSPGAAPMAKPTTQTDRVSKWRPK